MQWVNSTSSYTPQNKKRRMSSVYSVKRNTLLLSVYSLRQRRVISYPFCSRLRNLPLKRSSQHLQQSRLITVQAQNNTEASPSNRPPPQCHYCPGHHFHRVSRYKGPAEYSCPGSTVSADLNSLPRVRILLDKQEFIAEIDNLASEKCVNESILTDFKLRNRTSGPPHARLAAVGATIKLSSFITRSPTLQEVTYPGTFHISPELCGDALRRYSDEKRQ